MPGAQLERPKDCGKHARRGNNFSRTTGKCTAAPQTRRSVGKRSENVCNDTCISGTIGRATDYQVVRKHSSEVLIAGKYLIKDRPTRRRQIKEKMHGRRKAFPSGNLWHFSCLQKFAGKKKKIRWNTRDCQFHRNSSIFAETLRSKKTCGKKRTSFYLPPG